MTPPIMTTTAAPTSEWQKSALQFGWWILRVIYATQGRWQGIYFSPSEGPFESEDEAREFMGREHSHVGQTFILAEIKDLRGMFLDVSYIPTVEEEGGSL